MAKQTHGKLKGLPIITCRDYWVVLCTNSDNTEWSPVPCTVASTREQAVWKYNRIWYSDHQTKQVVVGGLAVLRRATPFEDDRRLAYTAQRKDGRALVVRVRPAFPGIGG